MTWIVLIVSLLAILMAILSGTGDGWTLMSSAIAGFFFRELLIDRPKGADRA